MAALFFSPITTTSFPKSPHNHHPPPPSSSKPAAAAAAVTFLCHASSKRPSSPPPSPSPPPPPSLSEQLLPLSRTLLKSHPSSTTTTTTTGAPPAADAAVPASKPTWVNPSKPKPTVLSLRRHPRAPFSLNPDLRSISAFARSLRAVPDTDADAFSAALSAAFPPDQPPPSRDDALLLLHSLLPSWSKSLRLLRFLQSRRTSSAPLETIFYNVVLKSLRSARRWDLVERLANEMVGDSVPLDNVTYSTIITAAKRCRRFDRAIEWFERMYRTGVMPDEVTYSAVLDVYAQLGKKEEVMSLYERARAGGWTPDAVAFAVLGKVFGEAGDYDGIQYVLEEMRTLGVKPNVVVYNTLLEAMGKAGKPGLARSLFEEMVGAGLSPNEKTLTALIKIYGKARWSRDALELWERMRTNRWPMDFILYNTLLSMCADLGLEDEAEKLFGDMKRPDRYVRPDSWSYTAMINIYGSGGKANRAMEMFDEMLASGVAPNVMSCTCLIQCLGKAGRIEDAARVFHTSVARGIVPDDRLSGCLLSVVALCKEGEMELMLGCLEKANERLVGFLKMLGNMKVNFDEIKEQFRGIMNEAAVEVRRPFCNCLIDICKNQGYPSQRASELLYLGTLYGLYPGMHSKKSDEWSLNLRSLSMGAAHTAFEEWIQSLSKAMERNESLPQSFSVYAGNGKHKFSQGLASAFSSQLQQLSAPFHQNDENGSFVASKDELMSWLQSRDSSAAVTA